MKTNFILFTFTVLFALNLYAQDISYFEMKSLLTKNVSDSEDFLISKKYQFFNQENLYNCENYDFAFNKNTYNDNAYSFISIAICEERKSITQSTPNEKLIPKIKLDAKKDGLKFIKTDNYEGKMINIYSNDNYKLMIMSKKSNEGFSTYEISLDKK